MDRGLSRRQMVAALGVTSTATVAGCLDALSDDDPDASEGDNGDGNGNGDDGSDGNGSGDDSAWPAIDDGEVISDFEAEEEWSPVTGELEAVSESQTGSQAIAVEDDGDQASMRIEFPRGIDLDGWDTSMAIKAESVNQVHVEFMAPERGDHLTSIQHVPDDYEGWLRFDFGYIQKHGEPDLSDVRRLNIIAVGPEDGTRIVVDDLRKTEAVDNGKAILALYNGHDSHYDLAADLLAERDWAAAVPVDPDQIGGQGRMDLEELDELRDRGWDVCSYPSPSTPLPEMPEDRQRQVVETTRDNLAELGFEDGSRHFVAPDDRMTEPTQDVLRDLHESAIIASGSPVGAPPTNIHMTPQIWGPSLHDGVRRAINLCDQYDQLIALRIPRLVEDEDDVDGNSMSLADFEHLLDHLEHRGLDVITPSDVVDDTMDGNGTDDEQTDTDDGPILEAGESHSFEGHGSNDSDGSDEFELAEGILTADFSHDGDSDLAVELVPSGGNNGDDRVIPTSATATASGESIITVDEGSHRLTVEADGAWSIDLDQPEVRSDDLESLPVEASGTGSAVVGPLEAEGNVSLSATHDGDEQFIVDGYGAEGSWEQLVNRTGEFDSSRSYSAGGAAWINIEADGDWTVEISDG